MPDDIKDDEGQKVDLEALKKRVEELESTNLRLLNESKDNKAKAQDWKAKVEELEKAGLDKADAATKADAVTKKLLAIEAENKSLKNSLLDSNIRKAIGKYAQDVHNIEDVINQRFSSKELGELLKSGINQDDFSLSDDVAKEYVNQVLTSRPHFKKTIETENFDATKPNGKGAKEINVDSAEMDDLKAVLKQKIINKQN